MTGRGKKADQKAVEQSGEGPVASQITPALPTETRPQNEPTDLPYGKTPEYRKVLGHYQSAEWQECIASLDGLLREYPGDGHLQDFRQEVQIRFERQLHSDRQRETDSQRSRRRAGVRALVGGISGLVFLALVVWLANAYRDEQTRRRLAAEATQTAEALAAKDEMADMFMRAGKAGEALDLYSEIQRVDPAYAGVNEAVEAARLAVTVEEAYQQGLGAMEAGDNERALEQLRNVERLQPSYKDTIRLIEQVSQRQQIAELVEAIEEAYDRGDSAAVIQSYETIQSIDPYVDLPELDEKLFSSYQELVLQIAAKPDPTLEEIQSAARYYRSALALFPQSIAYAREQKELQEVAIELLASQYYLQGISLLENSDYSIEGLEQSMLVLQRAREKAPQSQVADAVIEKAEQFIEAYDSLVHAHWDDAITGFEELYKRDPDFANGRVRYFLYDAYSARGDILMLNGDFAGAFADYQAAEQHAWADQENVTGLFEIEIRVAAVLRKLGRYDQALEFYQFGFKQVSSSERFLSPEQQRLREWIAEAELASSQGNVQAALSSYAQAAEEANQLYELNEITARRGDTLPNIAFEQGSTLASLTSANDLGSSLILSRTRPLLVPTLPTGQP